MTPGGMGMSNHLDWLSQPTRASSTWRPVVDATASVPPPPPNVGELLPPMLLELPDPSGPAQAASAKCQISSGWGSGADGAESWLPLVVADVAPELPAALKTSSAKSSRTTLGTTILAHTSPAIAATAKQIRIVARRSTNILPDTQGVVQTFFQIHKGLWTGSR